MAVDRGFSQPADFERLTATVSAEFQVEGFVLEHNVPTYYLKQPQETKQAFLNLVKELSSMNLTATLRKVDGKLVLKVLPKPPVKPSNVLANLALFFATVATTFVAGYLISPGTMDPCVGGASFAVAMLAVLGAHEMGHKIAANKRGVNATPPYFIPGPPPLGTFGAVIVQKSHAPNRDALFDVGVAGPIAGFIVSTVVSAVGLTMLIPSPQVPAHAIGKPLLWDLLEAGLGSLNMIPSPPPNGLLLLHPIAFAGWAGIIVTMLNLLPAGMLDGGHAVRAVAGGKLRLVLTALSIFYLVVLRVYLMAVLVLLTSMCRHPGPLDDVSSLSRSRKLLAVALIAIFVLCTPPSFHLL